MANELQEYLTGLGLKDEVIEKAVELAVPDTFRKDLAEQGGELKALRSEVQELRPLKEAPQRKAALEKFGHDYDTAPKYLKSVFDAIPADKLGDEDFVSQHLRENDVEVTASSGETQTASNAAAQVDGAFDQGRGTPTNESYEAAIAAASTPEELDAVYARFGKSPANA